MSTALRRPAARLTVTAANGTTFTVKLVRQGEPFGTRGQFTDDAYDLVEFYDARYAETERFDPEGQLISRYHADTILGRSEWGTGTGGLDLQMHEPAWKVDADTMTDVREWLAALMDA